MEIISRKQNAKNAAKNIQEYLDYLIGTGHERCILKHKEMVHMPAAIAALGDNPSPDSIDKIVGNDSYTSVSCSVCYKKQEKVVIVGQCEDNGGEYGFSLCLICLRYAEKCMVEREIDEI